MAVPPALDSYHHVRLGDPGNLARVASILSGRAVGLALGGGGARGYAHIGVVAALRGLGIPIDMVGGTSMGAVIAAQVALGLSREELINLNLRFMSRKPFAQYTIPMLALLNARRLQEGMQMAVGETQIKDLWINCFAISVNLTTTEMVVHDRGPVWEAVRASVSLPGILPPFVRGSHLLVDGGVINNLPGDVMRQRGGDPSSPSTSARPMTSAFRLPAFRPSGRSSGTNCSPLRGRSRSRVSRPS